MYFAIVLKTNLFSALCFVKFCKLYTGGLKNLIFRIWNLVSRQQYLLEWAF